MPLLFLGGFRETIWKVIEENLFLQQHLTMSFIQILNLNIKKYLVKKLSTKYSTCLGKNMKVYTSKESENYQENICHLPVVQ